MAIQIRRGTNANWDANNSNIVEGEPAITVDSERFFVGTSAGEYAEFANIGLVADEFSSSHDYIIGEICLHDGSVQKCTTPHSGAWDASDFTAVDLNDGILSAEEYIELANLIAEDYDRTATYFVGEFCKHEGDLCECNTPITTAEYWNASHWNVIGSAT